MHATRGWWGVKIGGPGGGKWLRARPCQFDLLCAHATNRNHSITADNLIHMFQSLIDFHRENIKLLSGMGGEPPDCLSPFFRAIICCTEKFCFHVTSVQFIFPRVRAGKQISKLLIFSYPAFIFELCRSAIFFLFFGGYADFPDQSIWKGLLSLHLITWLGIGFRGGEKPVKHPSPSVGGFRTINFAANFVVGDFI